MEYGLTVVLGTVRKITALKLAHEKYKVGKSEDPEFYASFDEAIKYPLISNIYIYIHNGTEYVLIINRSNPELKPHISKAQEDLNPIRVLNLFKKIPQQVLSYSIKYFLL